MGDRFAARILEMFGAANTIPMSSFVSCIGIGGERRMRACDDESYIIPVSATEYPIINGHSSGKTEKMIGFCPEQTASPVSSSTVLFNPCDMSHVSIYIDDTKGKTFLDSGVGYITAKNKKISFFIAWYLGLDEVSSYIQACTGSPMATIMNLPVPDGIMNNKNLLGAIENILNAQYRIVDNSNEIVDRLEEMKKAVVSEIRRTDGNA
jgi:hypothetical protein